MTGPLQALCAVCKQPYDPHPAYRHKPPVCDPNGYCGGFYEGQESGGLRAALDDVDEFARAIPDSTIQDVGRGRPALTRRAMRHRLLREEVDELTDAMLEGDLVEVADAYADIIYIVLGSAIMHIGKERFARVWDEVQRSNMAKVVNGLVTMRDDGKILKPAGWTPPDVAGVMDEDPKK